jgi:hypothetical protein
LEDRCAERGVHVNLRDIILADIDVGTKVVAKLELLLGGV